MPVLLIQTASVHYPPVLQLVKQDKIGHGQYKLLSLEVEQHALLPAPARIAVLATAHVQVMLLC
jgi:hypothetical protein